MCMCTCHLHWIINTNFCCNASPGKTPRPIYLRNSTLLPVAWRVSGLESLGDDFSVSTDSGVIEPKSEFALNAHFRAMKPVNTKKMIRLEVSLEVLVLMIMLTMMVMSVMKVMMMIKIVMMMIKIMIRSIVCANIWILLKSYVHFLMPCDNISVAFILERF